MNEPLSRRDGEEEAWFAAHHRPHTLFNALKMAARRYRNKTVIAMDGLSDDLTYATLLRNARILGHVLSGITKLDENVGVLLPTANATLSVFFALQAYGRVPTMLNAGAGAPALQAACAIAQLKIVVTSRKFIEAAGLQDVISTLPVTVTYLEDIRAALKPIDKVIGMIRLLPPQPRAQERAVILFTSGSEGAPKGVALSHDNLLSNIAQITARVPYGRYDIAFNALPLFHSFGLTAGALLPLFGGVLVHLYPNPLHYKVIPQRVRETNTTLMFAADTFLNGYARTADPGDFKSVTRIFAGAEALREDTRLLYRDRFGVNVYQGYGVTETSPVVAVNTQEYHKPGTVGRLMAGLEARLEAIEGIAEGGRLHLRGPNVMMGYIGMESPGDIIPPKDGWHDTGDIVSIDNDGYMKIIGRVKRFAKIGGEMVSLALVENLAHALWPDAQHAALSVPDERKGEKIILITTQKDAAREALTAHVRSVEASELAIPREIAVADDLPLLATGKTDYVALAKRLSV